MGFLDLFRRQDPAPELPILTKKPGFAITQFTSNNPFTSLIKDETNYFDQYILYTYKSIDYISSKVASSPIKLVDSNLKDVVNSDLWEDIQAFNPFMNLWEARKLREMHLFLTGAAFWYIDRDPIDGKRAEFYPLDPTQIKIKTDANGLPTIYQYTDANGRMVELPREDVIYFRRMDPKNWFEGQSIIKNILYWTNAYAQGSQYNMNKLGNNTNVDKFIVFEGIADSEREKVEAQLRNKYGGARNAGRTGVVSTEPKIVDVSSDQKDLDYVEGMKMLRQDILAAFGIPEALIFPSATNSNSKEAVRLFQSDTLEPAMQQEKAVLNEQLIRKYNDARSVKLTFDFDSVVDQDKNELVTQAKMLTESGIFTRDQALKYIGEEPIGGELGSEYLKGGVPAKANVTDDKIDDLEKRAKWIGDYLDKLIEEREDVEFRRKSNQMADDQEGIMYKAAEWLFQDQFKRAKHYIETTENPTSRGVFVHKEEVKITKQVFKDAYAKVIGNSNDVANIEIKQKLFNKNSAHAVSYRSKALSGEAIDAIARKLSYFADEISDTSQKRLRKVMTEGINAGFDKKQLVDAIADVFNGYIDGTDNINTLERINAYIPSIGNTDSRYKTMLKIIDDLYSAEEISKAEYNAALRALKGLIDPSDPIGKEVDTLLTNIYGVNKEKGIKHSRAVTIARTESTYARNLGFDDTYSNNPFIKGKKWKSLDDNDVRPAHGEAHNEEVPVGEMFEVDGEMLAFPGDTNHGATAKNIVNCRCRITATVID